MIAISFSFLAGRYHATPWARHVNEGAVEWPPSPWRVLRAIVATWKRTLPQLEQSRVEPILRTLAKELPLFALPPASTGHTRHYMPWDKKSIGDKTLIFDTFISLGYASEVVVLWPNASLGDEDKVTLGRILLNLNFLGRAESWCEARLLEDHEAEKRLGGANCRVLDREAQGKTEIVRVLCADANSAFTDDHIIDIETVIQGRGKNKSTITNRHAVYDPNWHLCMETLRLHEQKWSDPPGSRWVRYVRPSDCFEAKASTPLRVRSARPKPQIIRFALDSKVLPLITETLPVSEAARRMLMGIHGRMTESNGVRGKSDMFSGKDIDGQRLAGHRHAYYLPTDEDADGRLDHLTVVAEEGFDQHEMLALDRLREIKVFGHSSQTHPLRVLLMGFGRLGEYQPVPVIQPSREWVSVTPFIATRSPKERGQKRDDDRFWSIRSEDEINAARENGVHLRRRVLADPRGWLAENVGAELRHLIDRREDLQGISAQQVIVEPVLDDQGQFRLPHTGGRLDLRPIQFRRFRSKKADGGGPRLTGAFRIVFPRNVAGPISLGHNAHFGLGLFLAHRRGQF